MTLTGTFRKPFDEQVAAFRLKQPNLVPTEKWDDLWQSQHDAAWMVAGANKADLLADLYVAVNRTIEEGTTLEQFRKDFRAIVERRGWHGWTGEGTKRGEAWRTRVIYKTNLATSYSAGRWAQLKAAGFPLLVYRHGGSRDPRIEHLGWDGLILPAEHPFWATHAPPNGWGCSCYVLGARSEAGAVRLGGKPGKTLPPGWDALSPKTGAPVGIDRGWAYAPGASVADAINNLAGKFRQWPDRIAADFTLSLNAAQADAMGRAYRALPSVADDARRIATRLERMPGSPGEPPVSLGPLPLAAQGIARVEGVAPVMRLDPLLVWQIITADGGRARRVTAEDMARLPRLLNDAGEPLMKDGRMVWELAVGEERWRAVFAPQGAGYVLAELLISLI